MKLCDLGDSMQMQVPIVLTFMSTHSSLPAQLLHPPYSPPLMATDRLPAQDGSFRLYLVT